MTPNAEHRVDPRLRVLYLAAIGVGVFFVKPLPAIALLAASQALLWLLVRLGARRLLRQVSKLWGFAAFIVASYALTSEEPDVDRWVRFPVFGHTLAINTGGALVGLAMILRVVTVVLASQIARAGDGRAIAAGLGKLGVPGIVAHSIDAVLALLGGGRGGGGGGGGGRGRGGGGGRGDGDEPQGFWASVKRLVRGDVAPIVRRIERQIERVEDHLEEQGLTGKSRALARDIAVIAGVSLTMLGIKALKVLPSIPFAPGHKLVILTPLYIVARMQTRTRLGGTLTGLTMGTVAFLLGDGRYGIFEILKHVAPGVVTDLFVPILTAGGRRPGGVVWSVLGGLIGAGRFATIFVITLAVQAPAVAYAFLIPGFTVHTGFGVVSGFVTWQLVKSMQTVRGSPEPEVHESVTTTGSPHPSQRQDGATHAPAPPQPKHEAP